MHLCMDIVMKDSESTFSAVPVQLTATFRIVGLLCCETKRMVWFSLEHKAKGLRSSRSEMNPLLFVGRRRVLHNPGRKH